MPRILAYSGLALIVAGISWCGSMPLTLIAAGFVLLLIGKNESQVKRYREEQERRDAEWEQVRPFVYRPYERD